MVSFRPIVHQPYQPDQGPQTIWSELLGEAARTQALLTRKKEGEVPGDFPLEDKPGDGLWL